MMARLETEFWYLFALYSGILGLLKKLLLGNSSFTIAFKAIFSISFAICSDSQANKTENLGLNCQE